MSASALVAPLLVLLVLASASPVTAGRPLTTEDTGTLEPGTAEVELAVDYVVDGGARLFSVNPLVNIGLFPRLEGTIGAAVVGLDPDDARFRAGVGDTVVRLKYRFHDERARFPALIAAATARLPTGDVDRGLGEDAVDVQALAGASKTFGATTLTLNAGYTFITRDRQLDAVNLNASAETAVTQAWSVVGEVITELATHRRADDRAVVRAGTVYAAGRRVKLDAAAGFGVTRSTPEVLLTVGVTILID